MNTRLPIFLVLLVIPHFVSARVFTDDRGRQIEAELMGLNGANVVLNKGGKSAQWPLAKLSREDQSYVQAWTKDPASSPSIVVNVWEREGVGEAGRLEEKSTGPEIPKNIPFLKKTEEKEKYRYYDIDLSNNSNIDAQKLHLAYVIYVIDASNKVVDLTGSEEVDAISSKKKVTVPSKAATSVRTKTTSATFGVNPLGGLTTGSSTDRGKERFGGIWARVYSSDGKLLGERKQLHDELERLNFGWTGSTGATFSKIPLLETFEKLEELLGKLPKLPDLPKPPGGFPKPPF